jgi:long-chain fatty acid transport protein
VKRAAIVIVVAAARAHAGGLEVGEQTAVSAATGGAGAARDDDPSAAWHDPAALADGGGARVGVSLVAARPSLEARSADGTWTTANDARWQTPPHLDASFARDRWAAGIAVGVPFGGGVTWPQAWPGATEAIETQLMVIRAAPFFAWRFAALRVALGVHVDAARLQLARALDFVDTTGGVRMDLTAHGVGVDASALWTASETLAIAAVYRSRTQLSFAGPAVFDAPPAFGDKTPDQIARTSFVLPDTVVAGARWRRGAYVALVDVEYARWSADARTIITFANPQTPSVMQDNAWRDTVTVRAGGEWRRDKLVVRAGAAFDQTPVPVAHLGPSAPDGDRVAITAGASWRVAPAWSADAFVEQLWVLRRETTNVDTMPASYGGRAIAIGAGVRWMPR